MKKMELEIKILNVDKLELINKLENLGGIKKSVSRERMYVYDLLGINSRFYDILAHINFYSSDNERLKKLKDLYAEKDEIKLETAFDRLRILFREIDNLLDEDSRLELKNVCKVKNLSDLMDDVNLINIINERSFKDFIDKFFLNPKKWMRLREVNGEAVITVKHILPDDGLLQQIEEIEITVSNLEEANEFLETIGYRYKNYFEKERIKYELDNYEIDIDTWPSIPTYFEIEGDSEAELEVILNKLNYRLSDGISCTADKVFALYGKSMFNQRYLSFENN